MGFFVQCCISFWLAGCKHRELELICPRAKKEVGELAVRKHCSCTNGEWFSYGAFLVYATTESSSKTHKSHSLLLIVRVFLLLV